MNRFDYVKYDETSIAQQNEIKELCMQLEQKILKLGPERAASLALTNLEVVYMWCGKQIRDEQIRRNRTTELQEERNNG